MASLAPEVIEQALEQIPGVKAARVVADASGRPLEVHVVSAADKAPKQVVRDVQTVSLANFGLSLDHRIVSVVQMSPSNGPQGRPESPRPVLEEVVTTVRGNTAEVRVRLSLGTTELLGEASGPSSRELMARLGAMATLEALAKIPDQRAADLEQATLQWSGAQEVVLVTLRQTGPTRQPVYLSGSALLGGSPAETATRATLDALNRRFAK